MKYVHTFLIFAGIWFIASSLNGILCGVSIGLLENSNYTGKAMGLSILCSFIFSTPLVAVVWLVAVIAQLRDVEGAALFQTVLTAALIAALTGAVLFTVLLGTSFESSKYAVGLSVVISAVSAVLLFRNHIKGNENSAATEQKINNE